MVMPAIWTSPSQLAILYSRYSQQSFGQLSSVLIHLNLSQTSEMALMNHILEKHISFH